MNSSLKSRSEDELLVEYAVVARQLGEAVVNWRPAVRLTNRLFSIEKEIKKRGLNSRLKLVALLKSDNRFVRYYTAQELYGLLPDQCRPIIEANTREFDAIAGDARGFLRAIDEGTYKPE
jgi:hypothetical protein